MQEEPPRRSSVWDLTFPQEGLRPTLTVKVTRKCTCETVCGAIAEKLDVAEARIVLRDRKGGGMVSPKTASSELRRLYEEGLLDLEVLQGSIVSDDVVDGLVDFYERHVPVEARDADAVYRSMEELDMAAKRHAVASKEDDRGRDDLLRFDARGNATDRAEKQVETIRAQLSSTLKLSRELFPAGKSDLSRIVSRATLGLSVADSTRNCITEDHVFGDGVDTSDKLSREELEKVVKERKLARPVHIEKQMANVSKSMEEQLSLLLAKRNREPEQLAQDSLGSVSYSSTNPSMDEGAQTLAVPTASSLEVNEPAKVESGHLRGDQDGEGAPSTLSERGSIRSEEG